MAEEAKTSERIVLQRARVLVVPEDFEPGDVQKTDDKELKKLIGGRVIEAWIPAARVTVPSGARKAVAIAAHAGEPGTPDAKPGTYKSVDADEWKGGAVYERPPKPKVESRPLDD